MHKGNHYQDRADFAPTTTSSNRLSTHAEVVKQTVSRKDAVPEASAETYRSLESGGRHGVSDEASDTARRYHVRSHSDAAPKSIRSSPAVQPESVTSSSTCVRSDMVRCPVVVIGASPYGLSAAAHLIRADAK
jgi:hypothetical protein